MEELDQERLIGIREGYQAFREGLSVHVCDDDCKTLFSIAIDSTVEQVNAAIAIYRQGFAAGEQCGRSMAQRAMRAACGMDA
ncbi:hypothetical protein WS86_00360 (plasmid) [Burkholderia savannae]|uniref:hypothetical protein n=1 Tax=Burkholderia savannae TaxID=1637837 RepID=UPI0007578CE0|nr:hypothetical protein [Burkholderia savannae]AOJ79224.1 hypothetical protein WS86_00360 [Burkholderia savannae]